MSSKPPRRLRRFLLGALYRLLVLALLGGIVWSGYQVAQGVARRIGEESGAPERRVAFAQTATAILPTLQTHTPTASATHTATTTPTLTPSATASATPLPTATPTFTLTPQTVAQLFVTNTPRPLSAAEVTFPPTNTAQVPSAATSTPTQTSAPPTLAATPTLPAVTETPRPLPTLFVYGDAPVDLVAATGVPTAVQQVDRQGYDLMNILLLGNDGELTEDGFIRTDTMIIVSINRTTGTVSMLGLPRDLYVYIPGWTMQRLNLAYIRGETVGWTDGGFGLMRQTIFYNFGINVHYYAMVNLSGLRNVVDAVGGIDLAVDCAIQDLPLIGADMPAAAQRVDDDGYHVLPVGYYSMAGGEALWYARSRHNSIEFDRQRRQMQVLRAIWRKARDSGLLNNLPALWNEFSTSVETNLRLEDIIGLVPLAGSIDPSRIENFNMRRLYHTTPWQTPDGDFVQLPNAEPVRFLMEDFYSPPTDSQLRIEGATIRVLNGTENTDWDRVAADRLAYGGFNAVAAGAADNNAYSDTILIDYTSSSKGSSLQELASILNVRPENIRVEPDPNRDVDFEVILGANYNSCTEGAVLPVGVTTPAGDG
jgi:polyisoprenyl-teichoic acid--peptidoglycan teichoic acid transferase